MLKTPFKSVQDRTGLPKTGNYDRCHPSSNLATEKWQQTSPVMMNLTNIYIYTYTHTNIVIFRINMGRIGSALSFQDLSGQSLRCPAVPYPEKWPSSPHVPLASEDHTLGMEAMPRCANQDRSMPQFTTSTNWE